MFASRRPTLRLALFALASALLAFAAPRVARADTVTLQNNGIPQRRTPNNNLVDHPAAPYGINFDDCEKDVEYDFGVGVDTTAHVLQVWAGPADCSDPAQRVSPTGQCWPVTPQITQVQMTQTVPIKGRDIAAHLGDTNGPNQYTYTAADESACHHQTVAQAFHVTLYFMLFDVPNVVSGSMGATYPITIDLLGPNQPCAGSGGTGDGNGMVANDIGLGDGELMPHWLPPVTTDFFGAKIYCTPNPNGKMPSPVDAAAVPIADPTLLNSVCSTNSGGSDASAPTTTTDGGTSTGASLYRGNRPFDVGDGGDAGDGAMDDGAASATDAGDGATTTSATPGTDSCGTTLIDGMIGSALPPEYFCGEIDGMSATGTTITGLQNGTTYTIAVAGIDQLGNAGPIKLLGCQTPSQIENFFGAYVDAGGTAGGGFCATPPPGRPEESLFGEGAFLFVVVVTGVAFVRRRSSRRRA